MHHAHACSLLTDKQQHGKIPLGHGAHGTLCAAKKRCLPVDSRLIYLGNLVWFVDSPMLLVVCTAAGHVQDMSLGAAFHSIRPSIHPSSTLSLTHSLSSPSTHAYDLPIQLRLGRWAVGTATSIQRRELRMVHTTTNRPASQLRPWPAARSLPACGPPSPTILRRRSPLPHPAAAQRAWPITFGAAVPPTVAVAAATALRATSGPVRPTITTAK